MPEPPVEYTNALNSLKAFRAKIFADLVGGRVKASLDAQHESMQKYASVMDNLSVTPYFMGYIRHTVVALQLKGVNIGTGALRDVRVDYIGSESDYPMLPPYSVPQRKLPQVDVFSFTPVLDIELLDKANIASLQSTLLIQADSGTFRNIPDVENAVYDYYILYPNNKSKGDWGLTGVNPYFSTVNRVTGECFECARYLIKDSTGERFLYILALWLDAILCADSTYNQPWAVGCCFYASDGAPAVHGNIVGQRVESIGEGLWGSLKYSDALRGFVKVSAGIGVIGELSLVWKNTWKLTMEVNDPSRGHTDPPVGEHVYEAAEIVGVTAFAHAGYKFDHWTIDDVLYGTNSNDTVFMIKDLKLKAFFVSV